MYKLIDTLELSNELKDARHRFFRPKENNELNCFDLAVGVIAETIFSFESEERNKREFLQACGHKQH